MYVEQVRPAFDIGALGALQRGLDAGCLLHGLGFDSKGLGGFADFDVRASVIAGHIAAGLSLRAADEAPDAVTFVVVAVIVENDVGDGRVVARLAPERLRAAE